MMTTQGSRSLQHDSRLLSSCAPFDAAGPPRVRLATRTLRLAWAVLLAFAAGCSVETAPDPSGASADGGAYRVARPTGAATTGSSPGKPIVVAPAGGAGGGGGAGGAGGAGGSGSGPGGDTIGTPGGGVYLAHEVVVK